MDNSVIGKVGTAFASASTKPDAAAQQQMSRAGQAEVVAADAVTSAAKSEAAPKDLTREALNQKVAEAARGMNEFLDSVNKDIRFDIDEDTDRSVVKVVEAKSGEVIRQIPSEEVLKIAARMSEASGFLMEEKI